MKKLDYWVLKFGICLFLVSCFLIIPSAFPASLSDAQEDYLHGRYEAALSRAHSLRESDDVLYFLGLAYMKTGDYRKARIYLRKLVRGYSDSQFYALGLIKLADTYFLEKNYPQAWGLYEEIKNSYPNSDSMSLVYLRMAQIATRQGLWPQQKEYLKKIKGKYPDSPEIKFVKVLEGYGEFFTIQVGAFSSKKNAVGLKEELAKDYKPYIIEEKGNTYPIYKVRVGRFKKHYDAKKTASRLINQGYPARIYP